MHAFISKKLSLVLLLCSWCAAVAIILLLNYTLTGPRLGLVYDTLMNFRSPPPVSGEILLIETDEVIEPGDMFSVLMTLSEMKALNLVVEVPLLGTGSGMAESGLEFSYRINDEFRLIGRNISSLFEAIRLGLVSPVDSPLYVENLVDLSERGRDRLNAAIMRQDEAGSVLASQATAVFGNVITAVDLRPAPSGVPWYSLPQADSDNVLRRIAPVAASETEHIVYRALKPRWKKSSVEYNEPGTALVNVIASQGDDIEYRFPLDRDGNILIEKQLIEKQPFRRLTLNHFRVYEQTGRALARLLKENESLGVYAVAIPERIPLILYDHAETLKEEMLNDPAAPARAAWINARADYIASLDEFLYGPSEMALVNGFEEMIATEGLDETGIAKLQGLRDELIRAFVAMREKHRELIGLHEMLSQALDSAFCIMGPASGSGILESSALLANTLLTGRCITPGQTRYIVFWSLVASLTVLACIHALRPLLLLVTGLAAGLFSGAVFGFVLIVGSYWIDPVIPSAAVLGGTAVLFLSRFCIGYGRMLRFRLAYSSAVTGEKLKQLVRAGRPSLSETLCAQAVLIAVKNPGLSATADRQTPLEVSRAAAQFRHEFSSLFKQRGALVLGFENDSALACYGSPPQRICGAETANPAAMAVTCVQEIMSNPLATQWRFGIESGECAFSWSGETGYAVYGRPVVRAKIFSSIAERYHAQAIVGESVKNDNNLDLRKAASLSGESFYELKP